MKTVRIKKLSIKDWRGQSREVVFSPTLTHITGFNGEGKTTIADAVCWCLTGYDLSDRANYKLFDEKRTYTPDDNPVAEVEVTFDIDDKEFVFKQTAQRKYECKRGRMEYEKAKTDEYKFYVNGFAMTSTKYKMFVEEMFCPIDKLKLILNIHYYEIMEDWRALRRHFADIVGEITDKDLTGDYSCIGQMLEIIGGDAERAKKSIGEQIATLTTQQDEIKNAIDAFTYSLPDISMVPKAAQRIVEARASLEANEKTLCDVKDSILPYRKAYQQEEQDIWRLQSEIAEAEREYKLSHLRIVQQAKEELRSLQTTLTESIRQKTARDAAFETMKAKKMERKKSVEESLALAQKEYDRLHELHEEVTARRFYSTQEICPICGSRIWGERLDKVKAQFYKDKDSELQRIQAQGLEAKSRIEAFSKEIESIEAEITRQNTNEEENIRKLEEQIRQKEEYINQAEQTFVPFTSTAKYKQLMQKKQELEENRTVIPTIDTSDIERERGELLKIIEENSLIVANKKLYESLVEKIEEKKKQQKNIAIKLAEAERQLQALIERERERAAIIRERANRYLEESVISMTTTTKAGKIVDCCTLTINDVDRTVTNTATKAIIGIDISRCFQMAYDLRMPLFIDNVESLDSKNRKRLMENPDYQYVVMEVADHPLSITLKD